MSIVIHRYNSDKRQHFLLKQHYSFQLKPRLLYVGHLSKDDKFVEEPHSHEFLEIMFVSDGSGKVVIGEDTYAVKKGDVLIYNAGTTHFEQCSESDPMEVAFVAYDKLKITDLEENCLLPSSYGCVFQSGKMYDTIQMYFNLLIEEFEAHDRFYMEIAQNISRTLLMYIFRLINMTQDATVLLDPSKVMDTAVNYIDRHFSEKITLDELAEKCYTNKYHLSHLFTRTKGVSVGKYILDKRIALSKELLKNRSNSIEYIAEETGFHDPAYFCRVFKRETGKSPSTWRKET